MSARIFVAVLVTLLAWTPDLGAQRPWIAIGFGGGIVLGSPLVEHDIAIRIDDKERFFSQQVDLDDATIFSAHADLFLTRRISLRTHFSRGNSTLRILTHTAGGTEPVDNGLLANTIGSVRINTIEAGVSIWPWPPGSVGFAPFITIGAGRVSYDFDAVSEADYFHAAGTRTEPSFILGVGADLHVWRAVMLRFEAVNHRIDSPLQPGDFRATSNAVGAGGFSGSVSNVRLNLGLQIYLPFRTTYHADD